MNRSELELKEMGKYASAKYLTDSVPMDATITKMAKESSLNPSQVARVCESANVTTYDNLWTQHKTGEFTFDVANQEKIAEKLNESSSLVLQESEQTLDGIKDLLPPIEGVEKTTDKVKTAGMEKLAKAIESMHPLTIDPNSIQKLVEKLSHFKKEIELAEESVKCDKEAAMTELTAMLKTAAIYGENIAMAYAAARLNMPENEDKVKSIFAKVASDLKIHRISFEESAKTASRQYTEDALGNRAAMAVNKKHPILKSINTIVGCDGELDSCSKAKSYVVSKIELLTDVLKTKKYDNEVE